MRGRCDRAASGCAYDERHDEPIDAFPYATTEEDIVSCTRFLWTPICPRRDRNDDVHQEEDRRSFDR